MSWENPLQRTRKRLPGRARAGAVALLLTALFAGCASVTPPSSTSGSDASAEPVATTPKAGVAAVAAAQPAATAPIAAGPVGAASKAPAASATRETGSQAFDSLWDRIRAGFAMPELNSPLVAEKERFYLSKPEYLQRMFGRGSRYLFYIVEELEKRGMPTELALLPFVESAMNPVALSPAQAAGLWQFIPSTGKAYDLHQNWWVDNRRDPVKSTQAALDYLQKIYAMHGNDWFLALASYNWGEGAVARAVKKNQAKGRPTDYLSLDMPNETRHYVPKLIALKNILLRSGELGVALPALPNRPYFVTVEKTRPIDLKLAARFAGMSVDEFVALNPAHNRPVIAASKNNEIKLPADRLASFTEAVSTHEQARKAFATWQPYTLKPGETIESIAQRTDVQPTEIRRANSLKEGQRVIAGTRLLAPHQVVEDETRVESFVAPRVYEQVERPPVYHTVGNRESLASIASRYNVSAATLAVERHQAGRQARHAPARAARLHADLAHRRGRRPPDRGQRAQAFESGEDRADPGRRRGRRRQGGRRAGCTPLERPGTTAGRADAHRHEARGVHAVSRGGEARRAGPGAQGRRRGLAHGGASTAARAGEGGRRPARRAHLTGSRRRAGGAHSGRPAHAGGSAGPTRDRARAGEPPRARPVPR
jgi:membrane-bound lytic murein transglycosylase D